MKSVADVVLATEWDIIIQTLCLRLKQSNKYRKYMYNPLKDCLFICLVDLKQHF